MCNYIITKKEKETRDEGQFENDLEGSRTRSSQGTRVLIY